MCNGFLIAEVFSRYYKSDVKMHSFDNGGSAAKKKDNWEQLLKLWAKLNVPIPAAMVDDVLACKPTAAIALLELVYTLLTRKTCIFF